VSRSLTRRWGLLGLAVVGVGLLVWLAFRRPSEGPLYQGKTIDAWASQLLAPGPEVRDQAASVFRGLGPAAVPRLIWMLEWHDPIWRKQVWSLALRLPPRLRFGLVRNSPVPQESAVHQKAAMAVTIIGPDARAAVPALGRALLHKEPENLWYFADALGTIGKDALPALTNALANPDYEIRSAAIYGLGKVGPAAQPAVPLLVQTLKDEKADVRDRAVQALLAIGPPAVPALVQAVEQDRGPVRQGAARALMSPLVSWRAVEPALLAMLQDEDPASRQQALQTLGAVRARDEPAILAIAAALKDPVPEVRVAAAKALGEVCWKAQPAVPALVQALKDESPEVRTVAAEALAKIKAPKGR
jgi:HEAT repeat protein